MMVMYPDIRHSFDIILNRKFMKNVNLHLNTEFTLTTLLMKEKLVLFFGNTKKENTFAVPIIILINRMYK